MAETSSMHSRPIVDGKFFRLGGRNLMDSFHWALDKISGKLFQSSPGTTIRGG
jgi:hypothetical protein